MKTTKTTPEKQYRNPSIVENADNVAKKILSEAGKNRYRDHFFPLMINEMNLKIGVEIGTDQGLFAKNIIGKSKLEKLYCVDPWLDEFGSNYRPDYYNKDGSKRQEDAYNNLREGINAGRCSFLKGFSAEVCLQFNEPIDFLYIDGDHSLEGIYTDLYSWVPKVKLGGIIAGHDYKDGPGSGMKDYWGNQLPYKIQTVVDNFCLQYGFKLNISGGRIKSFWFVKN